MSDQHAGYVVVENDDTYVDQDGNPFRFKQGDRINPARAAQFPDLAKRVDGSGHAEARMVYGAPENRMEPPAPENRAGNQSAGPTVAELRAEAAQRGIEVKSDAKKAEIVAALNAAGDGLGGGQGSGDGDAGQGGGE